MRFGRYEAEGVMVDDLAVAARGLRDEVEALREDLAEASRLVAELREALADADEVMVV